MNGFHWILNTYGTKKGWSVDMVLYSVKVWYNNEILGKMVIVLVCYGTKWL